MTDELELEGEPDGSRGRFSRQDILKYGAAAGVGGSLLPLLGGVAKAARAGPAAVRPASRR